MFTVYITTATGKTIRAKLRADTWASAYDRAWQQWPDAIDIDIE